MSFDELTDALADAENRYADARLRIRELEAIVAGLHVEPRKPWPFRDFHQRRVGS